MRRPLRIIATLQEAMWVLGTTPRISFLLLAREKMNPCFLVVD